MRNLARRLLAASEGASDLDGQDSVVLIEKLQSSVTRFAGADGFTSLLRRAVLLAGRDVPSLHAVTVGARGQLEGFEQLTAAADTDAEGARDKAAVVIAAHLLELLVTFVGESLTLKLAFEDWPEKSPSK